MVSSPMTWTTTITLDSTLADSPAISYQRGGNIIIPAASSITSLTFYHGDNPIGGASSYFACYDSDGVAVTLTVAANRSYQIPDALFGCMWIKIVPNVDGEVTISMKG